VAAGGGRPQLRIAVVLSGGASLGAYEAGALAALLVGVRRVQRERAGAVVVDAVGGASAGALVGLFGAYATLEGLDPLDFLHEAWVERVSLDLLRRRRGQGLLSFDNMRSDIEDFLEHGDAAARREERPPASIGLHVSLTGLQGLTYRIRSLDGDEALTATTYSDWGRFVLEPGRGRDQVLEPGGRAPLDFALASAAHPGAFTPALLDRSRDAAAYRAHGIENFPASGHLWYSDGGLMQTEPLGRTLAAAHEADERSGLSGAYRRALVLIDPRSEDPSGASMWTDPEQTPKWLDGLRRALEILPAQSVYDDAVRIEGSNTRLRWASELAEALEPHLGAGSEDALRAFLEGVEEDRTSLRLGASRAPGADASTGDLLRASLARVGRLAGKERVDVNVVSPLLLAGDDGGDEDVPGLLAGDFMGDFGGFLDRDVRRSDFLLGYASSQEWLSQGLLDAGAASGDLDLMAAEVGARSPGDWREANRGRVGSRDLPRSGRIALLRLGWDALRAFGASAIDLSRLRARLRR
jgi:predicted acylesterase/phospholipase RssA